MSEEANGALRLYDELAAWWPLLSPPEEYAEEAAFFDQLFFESGLPPDATLLELGSGGGHNAFHLKGRFAHVTLSDRSPGMLAVSRELNPECEHIEGDMRTLRLGREFDALFIHDAIEYMLTPEALRAAMETVFVHCRPGGVALFVPDHVAERFEPTTDHGGSDGEGRAIRYLEWTYAHPTEPGLVVMEFAYLLHESGKPPRALHDVHHCGLFPLALWLRLLGEVGFEARTVEDEFGRLLFLCRRPAR